MKRPAESQASWGSRPCAALCAALVVLFACLNLPQAGAVAATPDDLLDCNSLADSLANPDGSLLALGRTSPECNYGEPSASDIKFAVLLQLKPDGTIDEAFASGGVIKVPMAFDENEITLLPDGTGTVLVTSKSIRRYAANGTRTSSVGVSGLAIESAGIQSDGKVVVVGRKSWDSTILARFGADGQQDGSFGEDGFREVSFFPGAMTIDSQDRIILGGVLESGPAALRLLPGGDTDLEYGVDGIGTGSPIEPSFPSVDTIAEVTAADDGTVRIYGEISDRMYYYTGFRSAIDPDGNPVPGSTVGVGNGHTGHAYAELPDHDIAYSILPGRSEPGAFRFGVRSSTYWPQLSPGEGGVHEVSYDPFNDSVFAVGNTDGPTCDPECETRTYMALAKVDLASGGLDESFGVGGTVVIPDNECPYGTVGPTPTYWHRCHTIRPRVKASFRFKGGASRSPSLTGRITLSRQPEQPYSLAQKIRVKLPDRLRIRAGKLRSNLFAKSPQGVTGRPEISDDGRRITFNVIPDFVYFDPFLEEPPVNEGFELTMGLNPGAIKPFPKRTRDKPLGFMALGAFAPNPDDPDLNRWWAPSAAWTIARARPVGKRLR